MSYDDWKTSAPDCDEEPCWRCKSAQKDDGNYCGDCAKGETMAELDLDRLESRRQESIDSGGTYLFGGGGMADQRYLEALLETAPALIAAARELAELKGALWFIGRLRGSLSLGGGLGWLNLSDAVHRARELGWTGKAER